MGSVKLLTRAIRPPGPETPNENDPVDVPPATVGPPAAIPGDPNGVTVEAVENPGWFPPRILPSAWSGWPAEWWPPAWGGNAPNDLTDTAWMCLDLNASVLASMPPYLVAAAPTLASDWLRNPDPDVYTSWEEFAKQLFWDYQLGEAFVLATAYYATGWPARFHVCPPWTVNVELGRNGLRRYTIGNVDVTPDILHLRYQGTVSDAHGHGPLEAGRYRMVAAGVLIRYATTIAQGIPPSVLTHPDELSAEQAADLQAKWVAARLSRIGEPAVLSGGVTFEPSNMSPEDMALTALLDGHERRIAALLGVPAILVGIPSGGDSMTYSNVSMLLDFHWRAGLRPKAQIVMPGLSEWLLPRGTRIELNRDAYIEPEPLERARTAQILNSIVDADGNPVLSVSQIREAERLSNSSPADLSSGVLR